MAIMGSYCKAYPAERFRAFSGWVERVPPLTVTIEPPSAQPGEGPEADTNATATECATEVSYYYLQENYSVTAGIFLDEDIAFDDVTEDWKDFCTRELKFEIPVYEPLAPPQKEEAAVNSGA